MNRRKEKQTALESIHFRWLMHCIDCLEDSKESWEVEDTLQLLWSLADKGDMVAFTIYGVAYLMEGKGWYDAKEGETILRNVAEAGSPFGQYFYGKLLLEGSRDFPADPISGMYWMRKSAESGFRAAVELVTQKWGR